MKKNKVTQKILINPAPIVHFTVEQGLSYIQEMIALAKPLQALGIDYFTYGKIVKNIRHLTLSNNLAYLKNYSSAIPRYPITEFIEYAVAARGFMHPRQTFSSQQIMQKLNKTGKTLQLQWECGMYHSISIPLFHEATDTVEIFSFYTKNTDPACIYQQFSHVHELANFILYFKEKAHKILAKIAPSADQLKKFATNKIYLSTPAAEKKIFVTPKINFKIKQYELGAPFTESLSYKEFQCLKMAYIGMTAKQMARSLSISYRTVEKHLENIRHKANYLPFCEIRQKLFDNYFFQILLRN